MPKARKRYNWPYRPIPSGELSTWNSIQRRRARRNGNDDQPRDEISEWTAVVDTTTEAPPWRPVKNPQATLQGLPTELRLQIYGYLSKPKLIHVHHPRGNVWTWTPCKAANPAYPSLCLNPKWSGLCKEAERCSFKHDAPPDPLGFWGLAATCKTFREEMRDSFMLDCVFSIRPVYLQGWLLWLKRKAPKQLDSITKVTLAGPDCDVEYPSYAALQFMKETLPNLTAVGYQCQTPRWRFQLDGADPHRADIDPSWHWHHWWVVECMSTFGPHVSVVVEGLVWLKERRLKGEVKGTQTRIKERQGIVRVIRAAKEELEGYEGTGWENEDVRLEVMQPQELGPRKGKAETTWRLWWQTEDLKKFGMQLY